LTHLVFLPSHNNKQTTHVDLISHVPQQPRTGRPYNPELVAHTTSFLDTADISRWMRTNRHALHHLRPCLYYKLQLHPSAIKVFARNARYVKSWSGDEWSISDYNCSLLAYKKLMEAEQVDRKSTATIIQWNPPGPATSTTTTATAAAESSSRIDLRILSWPSLLLPTNDDRYLEESVIPLPPFPSLHQVALKFRTAARAPIGDWWFDFGRLLAKTCWILQVHRFTLGRLSLKDVAVKDYRDESMIVQTIRSLELLQELELPLIESNESVCHAVASRVFFALPPSVQQVKISSDVIVHENLPSLGFDFTAAEKYFSSRREGDWDELQPERSEYKDGNGRKPPLEQLRTLHLWSFDQYVPKGAITSILKHAPQLEELGLSSLIDGVDLNGRALGELCPNLRRLVYIPGREPRS
jgi:hypothetical protein